jgi:serine/threonine protein kinase
VAGAATATGQPRGFGLTAQPLAGCDGAAYPYIVTIFQVGEDRGTPFLAMEFLEGEALDARLERAGRLPLPEVLRLGREIAEGQALGLEEFAARYGWKNDPSRVQLLARPAAAPAGK